MAKAMASDAVLFGAVGGPKWDKVPYDVRPEAGLLRLRKDLGLFANLRPAICYPALADASSLKREVVEGLDILIVRELTGGVYFGEPKTITDLGNGQKRGIDTQVYDTYEIERISRVAFELARTRKKKVSSAEKRNVMKTGVLWNEVVTRVHAQEYPDVQLEHVLADNCAMQLVRWPKQYDVIVTDNLFGDVLSDVAAMLTGSLGMLPSASLGAPDEKTGRRKSLYEPVHGSAPDIAGTGAANPIAMIAELRHGAALFAGAGRLGRQAGPGDLGGACQGHPHQGHRRRHAGQCDDDARWVRRSSASCRRWPKKFVTPAQAGVQLDRPKSWIPAFAGMTDREGTQHDRSLGEERHVAGWPPGGHCLCERANCRGGAVDQRPCPRGDRCQWLPRLAALHRCAFPHGCDAVARHAASQCVRNAA